MSESTNLPFRFGSEVYTWFMKEHGRAHANRLGHMMRVIEKAGFIGIQPIYSWMGDLLDPERLADGLQASNLTLSAMSFVQEWNHDEETEKERRETDACIRLLTKFPGALLCLVQLPTGRNDVEERRKRLLRHLNAVGRRAAASGITTSFHPNSPQSSITRSSEDYEVLLGGLNAELIGWTPDVGHIINAGMDPLTTLQKYAELINHVHYKDWDGRPEFALMGSGKVDFVGITRWLIDQKFSGWIICEDEAEQAIDDPDAVTIHDGEWIRNTLIPQL